MTEIDLSQDQALQPPTSALDAPHGLKSNYSPVISRRELHEMVCNIHLDIQISRFWI